MEGVFDLQADDQEGQTVESDGTAARREAEVSLLALQILLAHADRALRRRRPPHGRASNQSAKVLIEIRRK